MSSSTTVQAIERTLDAGLVPFLEGDPGIAKTAMVRQVAEAFNLKLIDVRLMTMDPSDIGGIPMPIEITQPNGTVVKRMQHVISTLFPIEGDPLPLRLDANGNSYDEEEIDANGNIVYLDKAKKKPSMVPARYDGWLVVFEEITSCVPSMQAASYRILLEREVGEYKLHPAVEMIATGNKASSKAVVVPMSTALRTRMCFIEVEADHKEWIKWANRNNIDPRVVAYLSWKPELLNAFDPNIKQLNCAIPRTWHFASKLMAEDTSNTMEVDPITERLLKGVIGAASIEFVNFMAYYSQLPKIADILKDPKNADLPTEPGHQYALTTVLAQEMATNAKSVKGLVEYTERMSPELQTVTYMDACRKNKSLISNPNIDAWVTANQDMMSAEI